MAMGIVSNEDFDAEMIHLGIISPKENEQQEAEVIDIKRGRGNKEEVPEVIRKLAAENVLLGMGARAVANAFGVSESSVSAYKNGATSTATYHEPNKELKDHTNKVRARITRKATHRLMSALNTITPETLADVKPRDAAAIAKDMSAIIKNIEPQVERDSNDGPRFVIYAPQLKQENDFNIIQVTD